RWRLRRTGIRWRASRRIRAPRRARTAARRRQIRATARADAIPGTRLCRESWLRRAIRASRRGRRRRRRAHRIPRRAAAAARARAGPRRVPPARREAAAAVCLTTTPVRRRIRAPADTTRPALRRTLARAHRRVRYGTLRERCDRDRRPVLAASRSW